MTGAGIAALVTAAVTFQTANASEAPTAAAPHTLSAAAAGKLASTLGEDLGADAAGTYYDARHRHLVVNVLDADAAEERRGGRRQGQNRRELPRRAEGAPARP